MEYIVRSTYLSASNIISSLGFSTIENIKGIEEYRSGIQQIEKSQLSDSPLCVGLIADKTLEDLVQLHQLEGYTRVEQLLILSIKDTLSQSEVSVSDPRVGIIISTTKGNISHLHHQHSNNLLSTLSTHIANYFEVNGRITLVSNACISGLSSIIVAHRMITTNRYDHVVVVGVDELSQFIVSGFQSFKSLSSSPCKPYDITRDGLSLGEACASILLSNNYTEGAIQLLGGGITNDANHISGPSRTGDGLYYAIKEAMKQANVASTDVDFVNLHGTATLYNDEMEAKAIHWAKLHNVPVNSLKPYFGHTLGASGILETIVCLYQMKAKKVYGTLGYNGSGVSSGIRVSHRHIALNKADTCVKAASGFGGCNAAIVLSQSIKDIPKYHTDSQFVELEKCVIVSNTIYLNDKISFSSSDVDFSQFIREAYKVQGESNQKFYKMDDQCKLGYIASLYLLKDYTFEPLEMGIVLANKSSSLDTDVKHQAILDESGVPSPSVFVYTLPNIVAGEICIRHKIQGENTFFVMSDYDEKDLLNYVKITMSQTGLRYCIYGWCNYYEGNYYAEMKLVERVQLKNN